MKVDNFESHIVFEKIGQLKSKLDESETKEKVDIESYSFFESALQFIIVRLELTLPVLVQVNELKTLSDQIQVCLQQLNSFTTNNNQTHITNASNNLRSAITITKNIPLPVKSGDFDFSKSVANFQKSVSTKYKSLGTENDAIKDQINNFKKDLKLKDSKIEELFKLVETKEKEIESLASTYQTQVTGIITKTTQQLEADRNLFRTEFDKDKEIYRKEIDNDKTNFRTEIDKLKTGIDTDTTSIIDTLEKKLAEATKLVNVIGNVGVTGNYQRIANEHRDSANIWRYVAIFFMIILSGLIIWTILDLGDVAFDWKRSLIKIVGVAILSYPATYAARESEKHRKLETTNRKSELELASIGPFIEILPEEKKYEIKEKLVEKYFANDKPVNTVGNKTEEIVSVNGIEKLLKTILPFIKR